MSFSGLVFVFLMSLLGGVFSWKILARVEIVLLGTWWVVGGLVSWIWVLVWIGFGGCFGSGLVFLVLVLVVLAKPVCVNRRRVDSTLMNSFWFVFGCGFGLLGLVGFGFGSLVGCLGSRFILGVLGSFGWSEWSLSGLLFRFGVNWGWGQSNLPLVPPLLGCT